MRELRLIILVLISILTLPVPSFADAPKVGRAAAAKYFEKKPEELSRSRYLSSIEEGLGLEERYMTFGGSTYTKSDSYSWGTTSGKQTDVGKAGIDMTYRLDTSNYVDYALRVLYTEYEPNNQKANKLSFLYTVLLPDAGSKFPLYFGAAIGPGIFMTQLTDESSVSLDTQLFIGLRIFNLFEKTGFYIESGLKNHLQLTSDGQLNGVYFSAGAIFTF